MAGIKWRCSLKSAGRRLEQSAQTCHGGARTCPLAAAAAAAHLSNPNSRRSGALAPRCSVLRAI